MPRKDRTYTGVDLVRFWVRNCAPAEQKDVLVVMTVAIAVGTARQTRSKFFLLILTLATRFAPVPWRYLLRGILRAFRVKSFEEEASDFYDRATRVTSEAGLTLGDVNAIIAATEDL